MATCLVRSLLPVITKIKFQRGALTNVYKQKCLRPETCSLQICPLPLWYSNITTKCKLGPISFNDVAELQNECETVIIDVRDRHEVEQTGTVPGSINIPHQEIDFALNHLKSDVFRRIYGSDKPNKSSFLVLFCRSGSRAKKAMLKLKHSGFENVSFYKGSYYEDWKKNHLKK